MKILSPLRHRPLAYLWGGQVFSAIGDELFSVALVWVAASKLGPDAGYIVAVQAASVLVFSLLGGIWADRWDHRRTMVMVDILRGITVGFLPIADALGGLSVGVLIAVTISLSSLRAFFDPALRASLPRLAKGADLMHATNALMETTSRLAKIVGPGLIGVMSQAVPVIHYFSIDALSFFGSAFSIARLKRDLPREMEGNVTRGWPSVVEGIVGGFRLSRSRPLVHFIIMIDAVAAAAWLLVFPFAIGILLHERMPEKVSSLSLIVGSYGVGNLLSNIVLGNLRIRRFAQCLLLGCVVAGAGFLALAFAPSLTMMMVAAAFAAIAGPMADLSKLTLIQRSFNVRETAKVYRFNMVATYAMLLLALLISPRLLRLMSVSSLIASAAILMVLLGVAGFAWVRGQD